MSRWNDTGTYSDLHHVEPQYLCPSGCRCDHGTADVLWQKSRVGVPGPDHPCDLFHWVLPRGSISIHRGGAERTHLARGLECHGTHYHLAQRQAVRGPGKVSFLPSVKSSSSQLTCLAAITHGNFLAMRSFPSSVVPPFAGTGSPTLYSRPSVTLTSRAGSDRRMPWSIKCLG